MLTAIRQHISARVERDPLLANADFRRYWFSSILTDFGNQIGGLAMPLCAIFLAATPAQMGIMQAWQAIPFAFLALPAGVWLDRRRKLPILLGTKALLAVTIGAIPVAWWMGILTVHWLYVLSGVLGVCSVLGGGAQLILLTSVVGRERLVDAQAKFAITDSISKLTAPGIAGILIQLLTAPFAMVIDACGYVLSLWNMTRLKLKEPQPQPTDKHPLRDMHDGLLFIWRNPLLRTLSWSACCWHLVFNGYMALQILFAVRELHMTPGVLGTTQMLGGLGVLASSMLLKPLNRRFGQGRTVQIGMAGTALAFMLMPTIPAQLFGNSSMSAAAYALLVFCFDCSIMVYLISYGALRQTVTPDNMLGRMISTMRFLTVAPAPLGALAAGYVANEYGVRSGLGCVAVGGAALTIAVALAKPLRSVRP
jgi:predicted MFS family arabinose efflux permease